MRFNTHRSKFLRRAQHTEAIQTRMGITQFSGETNVFWYVRVGAYLSLLKTVLENQLEKHNPAAKNDKVLIAIFASKL